MATANAGPTICTTAILSACCPQCGAGQTVCQSRPVGGIERRFLSCPHCGFSVDRLGRDHAEWKGYGVYVVQTEPGRVTAGAFDRPIPDHLVTQIVAEFLELGPSVLYLTRWNDAEGRLEVLLGEYRREGVVGAME
jgi:hypothetical protein